MLTIISGTNRKNSRTQFVASKIHEHAKTLNFKQVNFIDLAMIKDNYGHLEMYSDKGQSESFQKIQDEFYIPSEKIIIVVPEYNGSFPGILKLFIDALSVRKYEQNFVGKKVALVGISSGKGGNIMGISHLRDIFGYLGMLVMPKVLPVSQIETQIVKENLKLDTLKQVHQFIEAFEAF